ncbi:MAG: helix-turn-helix transcriptional regulator [Acidobacteriota bacterium]
MFATTSMKSRILELLNGLRDKAYRTLFVETQIETIIPFQIRAMRAKRNWTQKDLARESGMAQGRISLLENANYEGAVNVKTLVKLAAAFDVGLIVRFAPFSELAEWSTKLSREHHEVSEFSREIDFAEAPDSIVAGNVFSVQADFTDGSDGRLMIVTNDERLAA